ncbi:MAG: XRE family transcriptional regulator [Saprospiraceae bacterium]
MKIYTLDEVQDELLGKIGTPERDRFERALLKELAIKKVKGGKPK